MLCSNQTTNHIAMKIVIYEFEDILYGRAQLIKDQTCFPLALFHHQKQVAKESEAPKNIKNL